MKPQASAWIHDSSVDDVAVGRGFRALRRRRGWTLRDLAVRANVAASVVSDIELGRLESVRLPTVRRVGRQLGITVEIAPRWPVADVSRLLDAGHAALAERIAQLLRQNGWEIVIEYTFSEYGERGSVDILAWHEAGHALLLVEVKSRIVDVQDLHASFDRKVRIVPNLVRRERGWRPSAVGTLLVVADSHANRDAVRAHSATFAARFPRRTRDARRWLADPVGRFGGVMFLPDSGRSLRMHRRTRSHTA